MQLHLEFWIASRKEHKKEREAISDKLNSYLQFTIFGYSFCHDNNNFITSVNNNNNFHQLIILEIKKNVKSIIGD